MNTYTSYVGRNLKRYVAFSAVKLRAQHIEWLVTMATCVDVQIHIGFTVYSNEKR